MEGAGGAEAEKEAAMVEVAGEEEGAAAAEQAEVVMRGAELGCAVGTPDISRTRCLHFRGRTVHPLVRSTFDGPSVSTHCR